MQTLLNFLKENKTHFIYPIDLFDGRTPYRLKSSDSFLKELGYVEKEPENSEFLLETEGLGDVLKEKEKISLQVHSYLEIPEREKIRILPKEKKFLPYGIPVRFFLWVHSENYRGNIKAVLNHPRYGRKTILLGELNFYGWKRLEALIPITGKPMRLQIRRKELYELEEIYLDFQKGQRKGTVSVYLDRFLVLMEKSELPYPGFEMEDGWKLK